ncbi:MAG: hypothetical protein M3P44_13035, partial [Actinomycetota bacterium]|nr:hypothetical protein [Actinomycetota bacterium]
MARPAHAPLYVVLLVAVALAGCGGKERTSSLSRAPAGVAVKSSEAEATPALGFPATATKNTTRVGGADASADAAGVARAVFPATSAATRPQAVALIDGKDWHAGIAGAVLASSPVRAAVLLS